MMGLGNPNLSWKDCYLNTATMKETSISLTSREMTILIHTIIQTELAEDAEVVRESGDDAEKGASKFMSQIDPLEMLTQEEAFIANHTAECEEGEHCITSTRHALIVKLLKAFLKV